MFFGCASEPSELGLSEDVGSVDIFCIIIIIRVASHLACSVTPSITCVVARLSSSDPPHYCYTPSTNGRAPHVPLARDASPPAGLACGV